MPPELDKGRHLHPREIATLCFEVGWTHADKLLTAVAVVIAESNGYEHVRHENIDEVTGKVLSVDRGLWMLNNKYHPTVTDAMAYDARRATLVARGIYLANGGSFNTWSAYQNGAWKGPRALGYSFDALANFLREMHGYPIP